MFTMFVSIIYLMIYYIKNHLNKIIPLPPHRQNAINENQIFNANTINRNLCIQFSSNQTWFKASCQVSLFKTVIIKYLSKIILLDIPYISTKSNVILNKLI